MQIKDFVKDKLIAANICKILNTDRWKKEEDQHWLPNNWIIKLLF